MKIDLLSFDDGAKGDVELPEEVFSLPVRPDILARVVRWQLARRRQGTHMTRTTGEVTGTTAKFRRQKGGGSARHGSRKTNIFRGGAVAHGPRPRSHAHALPRRVRALGLKTALSLKAGEGKLVVVDSTRLSEAKTGHLRSRLQEMGISNALVVDGREVDAGFRRAASNIPGIDVLPSCGINVHDILRHDTLVLTTDAVAALKERLQ